MPPTPPPEDGGRTPVAYLGPEGTFSEEALLAGAAPGAVRAVPEGSIFEAVRALGEGRAEWAIVPIENSLDGSLSVTLDLLADEAEELCIVGEELLLVRHSLIGAGAVALAEIDTVLTHPQVPGQCLRFLRRELPRARVMPAASTAEAVRSIVAQGDRRQAAIGTALAAHIYGGTILREGIEDREDNETRFVWLGRRGSGQRPPLSEREEGPWKTSLVFWGAGAGSPGWLVRCLNEFADRGINLTRIESRPRRERLGSYMFFADLVGCAEQEPVASALAGVAAICAEVRVLGSYRGAGPATLRP
ncbi:MAG TPA: prephenate dehydratase [Solirubrobacteraceae bacterium]|nr:prephenate dehydratase [Solirubrobacteraceae bacterium]